MRVNELVMAIKCQVENIEAAEQDGKEAFVIARVIKLRELLNSEPATKALCS